MKPGQFLRTYSASFLSSLVRKRQGEIKFGERVAAAGDNWKKSIERHRGRFVLVGIPEDIGVRANLGRPGAHSAFAPALSALLNQQHNHFLDPSQLLVLGEIECRDLMKKAARIKGVSAKNITRLRQMVAELDDRVFNTLLPLFRAGKIPIVIGGGHNNAYGIIRALHDSRGESVNVINSDPHLDFRPAEGRHSGNSFTYAFNEGLLNRYAVFGMHEQYNSDYAVNQFMAQGNRLWFQSFESMFVREEIGFSKALSQCIGFVKGGICGVDMDLDSVTNMPSSARTSSGISPLQARQFVHRCAEGLKCAYLHIAEGAPVLSHIRADLKTGKFIAYLVSDFMKGQGEGEY